MVAGLERNDTGSIVIGGRVVSDAAAGLFVPPDLRKLGMVFQSYAIWPHMTVFDNVAYPLSVRHVAKAEIRDRVTTALRLVEMERFADRPAPALSGGQQQRVAIARALVFEPEVLLLDEPLSNLDARLRTQMGDEFRALQRRLRITTLYVTHDQEEAMALSDRVVVMQRGRILQVGAPEIVYRRPASREVASFFGTPNLIEAAVTDCRPTANGEHRLTIEGANGRGECSAGQAFRPGDAVLVVVRPEDVALAPPDSATQRTARLVGQGGRRHLSRAAPLAQRRDLGPALQRRMPGHARGGRGRNGQPAGRRRQCLGAETLTRFGGRRWRDCGRKMRSGGWRAATGRISSRPLRAACGSSGRSGARSAT